MLDSFGSERERSTIYTSFLGRRQAEMNDFGSSIRIIRRFETRLENDNIIKAVEKIEAVIGINRKDELFSCRRYSTSCTFSQGHLHDYLVHPESSMTPADESVLSSFQFILRFDFTISNN